MSSPFQNALRVEEITPIPIEGILSHWGSEDRRFLLESGLDVAGTGVWNFWGGDPVDHYRVMAEEIAVRDETPNRSRPLQSLDEWYFRWRVQREPLTLAGMEVPFTGGAVGWISYEALDQFHRLGPEVLRSDSSLAAGAPDWLESIPLLEFSLHDEIFVQHRETGQTWFLHRGRIGWEQRLQQGCRPRETDRIPVAPECSLQSAFSEQQYLDTVRRIQQGIGEGDYYEVNLARGFLLKGCPAPAELHRRWREVQPVPYAALIQNGDQGVVSASPEQFLCRRGDLIRTRPIKGTVPRSGDPIEEKVAAAALLSSEKERAELAMIVDLERNDLGRICKPGSVEVVSAADVESYASVLHAVATIEGSLEGESGTGKDFGSDLSWGVDYRSTEESCHDRHPGNGAVATISLHRFDWLVGFGGGSRIQYRHPYGGDSW